MKYKKKLPVDIENFEKIRKEQFYYVDKTDMIADLLHNWGEVNLFTRPRRFGKSLNMSMLKSFFEMDTDKSLFDNLKITDDKDLCEKYMGKFPVISITLKNVEGTSFESASASMKDIIGTSARQFNFLADSPYLNNEDIAAYKTLISADADGNFTISDTALERGLLRLSSLLAKHYRKQVIILIDEYDVPLDKAFQNGYYDQMVSLLRNLFGNTLKGNSDLYFAVLTGCLRISKESIFTGLNNFNVLSITDVHFDEHFGFTDIEVKNMLDYYGFASHYEQIKSWYNGYQFGNVSVYCPWDVIKYCYALCADSNAQPQDYWSNTSSNNIVKRFINKATIQTKDEIERLICGETISKEIHPELTYNEIDNTIDNLWSVLFTTGYLTHKGPVNGDKLNLAIPNLEIKKLFTKQIKEWFNESTRHDSSKLNCFCEAFPNGDTRKIETLFNEYLWNTISIRDTSAKSKKENFYHGMLLGLLSYKENWLIKSNTESGEGYSDILIEIPESLTGIVIEIKYSDNDNLDISCQNAILQIEEKQYTSKLTADGMGSIIKYGIACFKKHCKVMKA